MHFEATFACLYHLVKIFISHFFTGIIFHLKKVELLLSRTLILHFDFNLVGTGSNFRKITQESYLVFNLLSLLLQFKFNFFLNLTHLSKDGSNTVGLFAKTLLPSTKTITNSSLLL